MDVGHLRARADDLLGEFDRLRTGLGGLQQKLASITATVTSPDGYVEATVGARGQLIKLELDPRIYRRPNTRELAATITETIGKAAADAQRQVEQACRPFLPGEEVRAHLNGDLDAMFGRLDSELPTMNGDEAK